MASIGTLLQNILSATYGNQVRGSIHDALQAVNSENETENAQTRALVTTAQSTADTAISDAAAAQSTADGAVSDAAAAQSTADGAVTDAAAAQAAADAAQDAADAAQSTADTAVANAATAQGTADGVGVALNTISEITRNVFDIQKAKAVNPSVVTSSGELVGTPDMFVRVPVLAHGDFTPGETYTVSFDMLTEAVDSKKGLGLFLKDENETTISYQIISNTTSSAYTHISYSFDLPDNTYQVWFGRPNATQNVYHIKNIQSELGSETAYVPHLVANDYAARSAGAQGIADAAKAREDLITTQSSSPDLIAQNFNHTNGTSAGITYTWNEAGTVCHASGTCTGTSYNQMYAKARVIPSALRDGGLFYVSSTNPDALYVQYYWYINGSLDSSSVVNMKDGFTRIVPPEGNVTGMLFRIRSLNGAVLNDDIHVELVHTDRSSIKSFDSDTIDVTALIEDTLSRYGECRLGLGTFAVNGIDMPEGTTLRGSGAGTKLFLLGEPDEGETETDAYAIKMASYCTVENLSIVGSSASEFTPTEIVGKRHGILWKGNSSQPGVTEDELPHYGTIHNCWFSKLSGGAVTCDDTGTQVNHCLNVSDCHAELCGAGINIAYRSEFNRFTNFNTWNCYYGCVNNGGNNMFVNCGFSRNMVGLITKMVDGSGRTMYNNTHGSAIGCVFNHTDTDPTTLGKGEAVHIEDGKSGFVFSGGQIFYGSIYIKDSSAVAFRDFNIGNQKTDQGAEVGIAITVETTDGSTDKKVFMSDCVFRKTPRVTYTDTDGQARIIWDNCYTRAGTQITGE